MMLQVFPNYTEAAQWAALNTSGHTTVLYTCESGIFACVLSPIVIAIERFKVTGFAMEVSNYA